MSRVSPGRGEGAIVRALVVLLLLAFAMAAPAKDAQDPIVRAEVSPETVVVGEAATLRVTVLAPTWFTKPPVYPTFELPNAITRLPPDSSFPTNERVGGENWSGIVRDYLVYPQLAARYELSGLKVQITYADPSTRQPVVLDVEMPPVVYSAKVPAGAADLDPFIPSTSLRLEQSLSGEIDNVKVGDGVTRSVTATVAGLPSLFLPTLLPTSEIDGLSVYPEEPVTEDIALNRGAGYDGQRTEAVTYVFERGGELNLPAVELRWWNTESKSIETASLPSISIGVSGGVSAADPQEARLDWWTSRSIWIIAGLLVVLVYLGVRYLPPLLAHLKESIGRWRRSESHVFRKLLRATQAGSPEIIVHLLIAWLDKVQPGATVEALEREAGLDALSAATAPLYRNLYGGEPRADFGPMQRRELAESLRALRDRLLVLRRSGAAQVLPDLNPRGSHLSDLAGSPTPVAGS